MAFLKFHDVGISAISAAVPSNIIENKRYTDFFSEEEVSGIIDKIGVKERRFARPETCASDLCYEAAKILFHDNDIDPNEIGAVIFISQTPDYKMPATAVLLQDRLGIPTSALAFDINLGCSAFVYGLTVAYSILQCNPTLKRILILNGETRSKVYSPKDRQTAFIFGDAAAAVLIDKNEKYGQSFFSLNTDGSKEDFIKISAGGYRNPSSSETIKENVVDKYGNRRSDEHGYMNGSDVFTFVLKEVPTDIKRLMNFAETNLAEFDQYVFHQANIFINNYLIKKLKLDVTKIPWTIDRFGNTSSVSIPLTIVSENEKSFSGNKKILLSAFGVGMSWATGIINLENCSISEIVQVD